MFYRVGRALVWVALLVLLSAAAVGAVGAVSLLLKGAATS
jgi:hypothetical protein